MSYDKRRLVETKTTKLDWIEKETTPTTTATPVAYYHTVVDVMEMVINSSSILEKEENQGGHHMLYPLHDDAPDTRICFVFSQI